MFHPHFLSQIAFCHVLGIEYESLNFPVYFLFFKKKNLTMCICYKYNHVVQPNNVLNIIFIVIGLTKSTF